MALTANYGPPIYLCNTTTTGLQTGIVLDATGAFTPGLPIPFQIIISATATVLILAALEVTPAGVLVDPQDVSGGGFTASNFYDLITTIPFYQVNVTANTGTVKVKVSSGATAPGQKARLNLLTFSNIATAGM